MHLLLLILEHHFFFSCLIVIKIFGPLLDKILGTLLMQKSHKSKLTLSN